MRISRRGFLSVMGVGLLGGAMRAVGAGDKALDDLVKEFSGSKKSPNIDANRLYLTGFSQGGMGTWNFIRNYPRKFAAAAPLSGYSHGPQNVAQAKEIRHIPIWIFNGDGDKGGSRLSFKMLKQAGASDVRYHEYKKQRHVIDDFAYFTKGFMNWLFAQKRTPSKAVKPGKTSKSR